MVVVEILNGFERLRTIFMVNVNLLQIVTDLGLITHNRSLQELFSPTRTLEFGMQIYFANL